MGCYVASLYRCSFLSAVWCSRLCQRVPRPQRAALMVCLTSCFRRVQRLRQLHKNTYVTPKARANFGQMTAEQKKQLEGIGFMFELPDDMKVLRLLPSCTFTSSPSSFRVTHTRTRTHTRKRKRKNHTHAPSLPPHTHDMRRTTGARPDRLGRGVRGAGRLPKAAQELHGAAGHTGNPARRV